MDPDEAADLLRICPRKPGAELLGLMERDEAVTPETAALPSESAGGIMTTDYGWILNGAESFLGY